MKIIGCDLHARQQTIAMLDSDTGSWRRRPSNMKARPSGSFIPHCLVRFWWGSKRPAQCSGSWN